MKICNPFKKCLWIFLFTGLVYLRTNVLSEYVVQMLHRVALVEQKIQCVLPNKCAIFHRGAKSAIAGQHVLAIPRRCRLKNPLIHSSFLLHLFYLFIAFLWCTCIVAYTAIFPFETNEQHTCTRSRVPKRGRHPRMLERNWLSLIEKYCARKQTGALGSCLALGSIVQCCFRVYM